MRFSSDGLGSQKNLSAYNYSLADLVWSSFIFSFVSAAVISSVLLPSSLCRIQSKLPIMVRSLPLDSLIRCKVIIFFPNESPIL